MKCLDQKLIYPHRSIDWCDRNEERPIMVPCGKCPACLSNRRNDWSFRLQQEHKASKSAYMVTLTYDDKHVPADGSVHVEHLQLYFKRLRQHHERGGFGKNNIRYYAVGEYGTKTRRPHYHILLFNCPESIIRKAWKDKNGTDVGFVHVGRVTGASVAYVTKYIIQKADVPEGLNKPFVTMSRAYGIGGHYLTDEMVQWHRDNDANHAMLPGNEKTRLPRFYRDKIWFKPKDRERISAKAMIITKARLEKEKAAYQKMHGDSWERHMIDAERRLQQSVKSKIAYTQRL